MFENESVDFDYDEVDKNLGNAPSPNEKDVVAIETINKIFDLVFEEKTSLQESYLNYVALVYIVKPELICGKTLREIGNELAIPKSNLGRIVMKMRDRINFAGVLCRPNSQGEKLKMREQEQYEFEY
jgi:hypothetical protein